MNIKPLADRVVVKVLEAEEKTASGIVLPDKAREKPQEGEVMAVGDGKVLDNGNRMDMELKVGDKIIFSRYAGAEVKVDGEEYLILRQDDILAVVQ
ncbi:MAG: co-chaperone GroES [Bacillota bacterium]